MGHTVGYIRVSTAEQKLERQLDGLKLDKVFEDVLSGKDTRRDGLTAALNYVRGGDELVVHEMSRLGRNSEDLLRIVRELTAKGVAVRFVSENLRIPGSAEGEPDPFAVLMLQMLAAFAQFERGLLLQRQREGIAVAKAAGKYKGRKPRLTSEQARKLVDRVNAGEPIAPLAREFGISRASVYNYAAAADKSVVSA